MEKILNGLGVGSGPAGLASLGLAVNLSYSGSHKTVTYLLWWVLTIVLLSGAAFYWFWGRRHLGQQGAISGDRSTGGTGGDAISARGSSAASAKGPAISNPQVSGDFQIGDRYELPREFVSDPPPPTSWDRVLADAITELEGNRKLFQHADGTKHLPNRPPTGAYSPLADQLAGRGLVEARVLLDSAYGECKGVWTRYGELPRFEGPMADPIVPEVDESVKLPDAIASVESAVAHLRMLQRGDSPASLGFGPVEVGVSREIKEANVFTENWSGMPIVFNLVNPHGGERARDIRPTVTVEDTDGNVLAGPANARWANPIPPNVEEVERDIPANGAPVAIDTVIQDEKASGFWLITDEGLRRGLKANTQRIRATDFRVTVSVQGENVALVSETVRVRLGFPKPALGDGQPADTMVPPPPPDNEPEGNSDRPDPPPATPPETNDDPSPPPQPPKRSFGLKGDLEVQRDEGYKLLSALKGGLVASWKYDRIPSSEDVESWAANVEHLLRNDSKRLYLFRWQPLNHSSVTSLRELVASALGGSAAALRLEHLLAQLEKVIEGL